MPNMLTPEEKLWNWLTKKFPAHNYQDDTIDEDTIKTRRSVYDYILRYWKPKK